MGDNLLGTVTDATGLPKDLIWEELERLIAAAGVEKSEMTLEDLRQILAEYMQDVLLDAHSKFESPNVGTADLK